MISEEIDDCCGGISSLSINEEEVNHDGNAATGDEKVVSEYVSQAQHPDAHIRLSGVNHLRSLLSRANNPPIQLVVASGVIQTLVRYTIIHLCLIITNPNTHTHVYICHQLSQSIDILYIQCIWFSLKYYKNRLILIWMN